MLVKVNAQQLQSLLEAISVTYSHAGFSDFGDSTCVLSCDDDDGSLTIRAGCYGIFVTGKIEAACKKGGHVLVNAAYLKSLKLSADEIVLKHKGDRLLFKCGRLKGAIAVSSGKIPEEKPLSKVRLSAKVPRQALLDGLYATGFKSLDSTLLHVAVEVLHSDRKIKVTSHDNYLGCFFYHQLSEDVGIKRDLRFVTTNLFLTNILQKFSDDLVRIGASENTFRLKDSCLDVYFPIQQRHKIDDIESVIGRLEAENKADSRLTFQVDTAEKAIAQAKSIADLVSKEPIMALEVKKEEQTASCRAESEVGKASSTFDLTAFSGKRKMSAERPLMFNSAYLRQIFRMLAGQQSKKGRGKSTKESVECTLRTFGKMGILLVSADNRQYLLPEIQDK